MYIYIYISSYIYIIIYHHLISWQDYVEYASPTKLVGEPIGTEKSPVFSDKLCRRILPRALSGKFSPTKVVGEFSEEGLWENSPTKACRRNLCKEGKDARRKKWMILFSN